MAEKSEQIEENLVKKTCRELGITQKELAEKIGVSESTIKRSNKIIETTLNLLLENYQLKNRINNFQNSFTLILQPI
jgi:predicted transcriptional regulator